MLASADDFVIAVPNQTRERSASQLTEHWNESSRCDSGEVGFDRQTGGTNINIVIPAQAGIQPIVHRS